MLQLRKMLLLLGLLSALAACNNPKMDGQAADAASTRDSFKISGRINGFRGSQNMYISYQKSLDPQDVNALYSDSVVVKDGVFVFEGKLPSPQIVTLTLHDNNIIKSVGIFMGNEEVSLEADLATMEMKNMPTIKGSPIHDEFKKVDEFEEFVNQNLDELMAKSKAIAAAFERNDRKAIGEYCREQSFQRKKATEERLNYARNNPNSYVSAFLMDGAVYSFNHLPLADYEAVYNSLSEPVRQSLYGLSVKKAIDTENQSTARIGAVVPDVAFTDINGKKFKMSDFKGKLVLIEYWFPSCMECQCGKDEITEAQKNHPQELVVMDVSSDDNLPALRNAIATQGRNWLHVIDTKGDFAFGQGAIVSWPLRILLDKERKIIARYDDVSIGQLGADLQKFNRN
jgi:peroxiredoxin